MTGTPEGERIAKVLARAGVASRREAERMIADKRIAVNGAVIDSPALNVTPEDAITVDGEALAKPQPVRVWRYHKPKGLLTTHKDPQGRATVFEQLPPTMPRVVSVGRLDMNSEGLLLLTTDGGLARALELPATGWKRRYRVRVYGTVSPDKLKALAAGMTVDGVRYGSIQASIDADKQEKANTWLTVTLTEGKNREIRRVMSALELEVSRLIRVAYGPFQLGQLRPGQIEEVPGKVLREQLGDRLAPPKSKRAKTR